MNTTTASIESVFRAGGVFAYPTEAVFGIGCDPSQPAAIERVLQLKGRPQHKGLILLAADYSQLLAYVDDKAIPQDKRFAVLSYWPGPVTLLLPARKDCPALLRGEHETIAVRVTAFAPARALCKQLRSAIVSTSANRAGQPALTTAAAVAAEFGSRIDFIVEGETGGAAAPSRIIDPLSGIQYR